MLLNDPKTPVWKIPQVNRWTGSSVSGDSIGTGYPQRPQSFSIKDVERFINLSNTLSAEDFQTPVDLPSSLILVVFWTILTWPKLLLYSTTYLTYVMWHYVLYVILLYLTQSQHRSPGWVLCLPHKSTLISFLSSYYITFTFASFILNIAIRGHHQCIHQSTPLHNWLAHFLVRQVNTTRINVCDL